jgi:hypothetical protein
MNEKSLVGKCGLYCGACGIYRAQRDSEEWRNRIASNYNCMLEQVCCNGCGDLTSECWGDGCKIVLCTRAKGVSHCFECPEYESGSCEKFEDLSRSYLEAGVDLRDNLVRIKEGKTEEWLEESRKKFTCKSCGSPIAVWNKKCHHCGDEIKK